MLSVNEGNPAGLAAYRKAGFEDRGRYLGGDAGPQRTMYRRLLSVILPARGSVSSTLPLTRRTLASSKVDARRF